MRIVSLLPSATEIVCALGAGPELVGVSHECDFPPAVRGLPALTRPKIRTDTSSAAIDRSVRALVTHGLGIYEIDVEGLRTLRPDVIVTQEQCAVCAVPYAEVAAAARSVLGADVAIVSLTPAVLADVWRDIERVGAALGRAARAAAITATARERLGRLAAAAAERPRPVVACIEWLEPLMLAGNWIPELVALAGGAYPFVAAGAASPACAWDALTAAAPEVAVVMPCGFDLAQTRRELATLAARPEWHTLPAVRAGRAYAVDGNAYFNRPGPRLVESAEILAGLVHPDLGRDLVPAGAAEPIAAGATGLPERAKT